MKTGYYYISKSLNQDTDIPKRNQYENETPSYQVPYQTHIPTKPYTTIYQLILLYGAVLYNIRQDQVENYSVRETSEK